MKKIAVLTSGNGDAAWRIASLFNEGNRVRVEAVAFAGETTDPAVVDRFRSLGLRDIILSPEADDAEIGLLLGDLDATGIEMYVFDGLDSRLEDIVTNKAQGRTMEVTTPEEAPREVVAAITPPRPAVHPTPAEPSADEEWAETLQASAIEEEDGDKALEVTAAEAADSHRVVPDFAANPLYGKYQAGNRPVCEEPMPPSYLLWSVVMAVFFFTLFGVIAIYFSSKVSSKYYEGDLEGARRCSARAEAWIIASFCTGVISATIWAPIYSLL